MSKVACLLPLTLVACAPAQGVQVQFDPNTVTGPISPYVYGTNQPDWGSKGKGLTFVRWGGNRTTAYNWETNASNAGSDYLHQNDDYLGGGLTPLEALRPMVATAFANGALAALVTIPTIGYVSADKNGGGDVNATPNYINVRFKRGYARKGSKYSEQPNVADNAVYMDEMAFAVRRKFAGKKIWFALDNEADLWDHTHARLRTSKLTYDEILGNNVEYAKALKSVAPDALIFGPASYGWNGYTTLQDAPDKNKGDFLSFYLTGLRKASKTAGKRLLDVLDLHYYSEARSNTNRVTEDANDADTVAARVQSGRSFYDPNFTESSWITQYSTNGPINLLPRMASKIAASYPGTKLAFTEWNLGGGNHPSGAVATADAVGAFGKWGVFAANHWHLLGDERYAFAGLGAFRNFDGLGGKFGSEALPATTGDIAKVQIYASREGADKVVIVLINRQPSASSVTLKSTSPFIPISQRAFVVGTTGSTPSVASVPAFVSSGSTFTLPSLSVTTIELNR